MVFHRFQQLPAELRLQIWECAVHEILLIEGLADGQKRVCRMVAPQSSPESSNLQTKLVTLEDVSLGHICHESREVLHRCRGRLDNARDYVPSTDVIYIDCYAKWFLLDLSLKVKARHIALSTEFCYDMLKIEGPSPTTFDQLGLPRGAQRSFTTSLNSCFLSFAMGFCLNLESITVVLPPLEKNMPHYADNFPMVMRPSFLKIVPYSEIQRIKIRGTHTYTSWLRGSANTKRLYLGPFIKDVDEVWQKQVGRRVRADDPRGAITVQAGVVQYLEGPFQGEMRLSSVFKEAEDLEESQSADQDGAIS